MGLFDIFRRSSKVEEAVAPRPPVQPDRLPLRVGNLQGIGLREDQQDSFAILNAASAEGLAQQGLFATVCDGMGGMEGGRSASEAAVEGLCQAFRSIEPGDDAAVRLEAAVRAVSDQVFCQFVGRSGTTAVAVRILGGQLHWVSVGDSAVYLYRDGGVFQLNREHTYLNYLYTHELAEAVICRERAEQNEDARRLTSFVGIDHLREVDVSRRPLILHRGDAVLLCSDGISGALTPPELAEAMRLPPDEGCALLETMIWEKRVPEQDNYTGVLISCET